LNEKILYYPEISYIYPTKYIKNHYLEVSQQIKVLSLFFDHILFAPTHLAYQIVRNKDSSEKLMESLRNLLNNGKVILSSRSSYQSMDERMYYLMRYLIDVDLIEFKESKDKVVNLYKDFPEKLLSIIDRASFERIYDGKPYFVPFSCERLYSNLFEYGKDTVRVSDIIAAKYFESGAVSTNSFLMIPSFFDRYSSRLSIFLNYFERKQNIFFMYQDLMMILKVRGIDINNLINNVDKIILSIGKDLGVILKTIKADLTTLANVVFNKYDFCIIGDPKLLENEIMSLIVKEKGIISSGIEVAIKLLMELAAIGVLFPFLKKRSEKISNYVGLILSNSWQWREFVKYINKFK